MLVIYNLKHLIIFKIFKAINSKLTVQLKFLPIQHIDCLLVLIISIILKNDFYIIQNIFILILKSKFVWLHFIYSYLFLIVFFDIDIVINIGIILIIILIIIFIIIFIIIVTIIIIKKINIIIFSIIENINIILVKIISIIISIMNMIVYAFP